MRNLQIVVEKLIGKVLISLLYHAKSATSVISIVIDAHAVYTLIAK